MNSEMQKRLYEMEVTPPRAVWEKLSLSIDEINEDNRIAEKVLNAELVPPPSLWRKINSTMDVAEEKPFQKKAAVINLRSLAVAALFIGIVATAWLLFRNSNSTRLASVEKPSQQKTSTDTNTNKNNPNLIDSPIDRSPLQTETVVKDPGEKNSVSTQPQPANKRNNSSGRRNGLVAQAATAQFASLTKPLGNNFNQPIDDLSLVTSGQNYLTMVNANGRLVKIPAQLASLAPHLQDKPVSEDYYEVMFGEGNYWKETLNEWRKKVASAPISTGDAFTSLVELLKNVQNR